MNTLFDEFEVVQQKGKGNPYHSRRGRYTNKLTAAKEKSDKRADVAENRLEYISSCYFAIGKLYSRLLRENEQLKCELNSYKNKIA